MLSTGEQFLNIHVFISELIILPLVVTWRHNGGLNLAALQLSASIGRWHMPRSRAKLLLVGRMRCVTAVSSHWLVIRHVWTFAPRWSGEMQAGNCS